jgi:hypothetical protein
MNQRKASDRMEIDAGGVGHRAIVEPGFGPAN